MATHIGCPLCGKASLASRFPTRGPVDVVRLTFKGAGRGRGFVVTDRSSALEDPSVCEPLASRVLKLLETLMQHGYVFVGDLPGLGNLVEWERGLAEREGESVRREFLLKREIDDLRRNYKDLESLFDRQSCIISGYETQNRLRESEAKTARHGGAGSNRFVDRRLVREPDAGQHVDSAKEIFLLLARAVNRLSDRLQQVDKINGEFTDALLSAAEGPTADLVGVKPADLRSIVYEYRTRVESIAGGKPRAAGPVDVPAPQIPVTKAEPDRGPNALEPAVREAPPLVSANAIIRELSEEMLRHEVAIALSERFAAGFAVPGSTAPANVDVLRVPQVSRARSHRRARKGRAAGALAPGRSGSRRDPPRGVAKRSRTGSFSPEPRSDNPPSTRRRSAERVKAHDRGPTAGAPWSYPTSFLPTRWIRLPAALSEDLRGATVNYTLYDDLLRYLYEGMSRNAFDEIGKRLREPRFRSAAAYLEIRFALNEKEARSEEKARIAKRCPIHNIQHAGKCPGRRLTRR